MFVRNSVQAVLGATCTALSLEFCYIPHGLMDGGMTGVAVLMGRTAGIQPVYVLTVLNGVCLLVGFQRLGRRFLAITTAGLITLGVIIRAIGPFPSILSLPVSTVVGGLGIGLGTALVLRAGGGLDGCEILGVLIQDRLGISVVWVLAAANVVVFGIAVGMYGLTTTLPSVMAQVTAQLVILFLLVGNRARRPEDKPHYRRFH